MKSTGKANAFSILTVMLIAWFPVAFLYFQNANEVRVAQAIPMIVVWSGLGIALYLLICFITKKMNNATIITGLFLILMENFALIEMPLKVLGLRYWHTAPIIIVVGLHVGFFVWKMLPDDIAEDVTRIVALTFGVLILFNLGTNFSQIMNRIKADKELTVLEKGETVNEIQTEEDNPNIYLIIFDEFANFTQMEQGYGYDNQQLKSFLSSRNFTTSYDTHNESIMSSTVITNLMNLDYVVTNDNTESDKSTLRKQGKLFSIMREQGYTVQVVEVGDFLGQYSPTRGNVSKGGTTAGGQTFSDLCIEMSILYPFFKNNHIESMDGINNVVSYICEMDKPERSTFTVSYLGFPHMPFLVDENGNQVPVNQSMNFRDKRYYLGQYIYATKIMIQMLDSIIRKDPGAVILCCSDHSVRAATDPELFLEGCYAYEYASNPLNTVYFRGEPLPEIIGQSEVNTLRTVLNALWGTDYEILEVPKDTYKYK